MKTFLASLLFLSAPVLASTDYAVPNSEVGIALSIYGNACSFSSPKFTVTISDPMYAGGALKGPVTQQTISGTTFTFMATVTDGQGNTAVLVQEEVQHQSGGRAHTCYFVPATGTLTLN